MKVDKKRNGNWWNSDSEKYFLGWYRGWETAMEGGGVRMEWVYNWERKKYLKTQTEQCKGDIL